MTDVLPTGYTETMSRLNDPDNWDIEGMLDDIARDLRTESDSGRALAAIDFLRSKMSRTHQGTVLLKYCDGVHVYDDMESAIWKQNEIGGQLFVPWGDNERAKP